MTEIRICSSERFHRAMVSATKLHKDQTLKSPTIAHISHPFEVASLVLEANGDEDQAIAALSHDVSSTLFTSVRNTIDVIKSSHAA